MKIDDYMIRDFIENGEYEKLIENLCDVLCLSDELKLELKIMNKIKISKKAPLVDFYFDFSFEFPAAEHKDACVMFSTNVHYGTEQWREFLQKIYKTAMFAECILRIQSITINEHHHKQIYLDHELDTSAPKKTLVEISTYLAETFNENK